MFDHAKPSSGGFLRRSLDGVWGVSGRFLGDIWKGMECVWRLSTNNFQPENNFEPKTFMAQHFSDTEFFRYQIFQVPNFSDQQIFKQEIGGPKILLTKYFLT